MVRLLGGKVDIERNLNDFAWLPDWYFNIIPDSAYLEQPCRNQCLILTVHLVPVFIFGTFFPCLILTLHIL